MWKIKFWIALLFAGWSWMFLAGCATPNGTLAGIGQSNATEEISRGDEFRKANQYRKSIDAYSNAIKLDPINEVVYYKRGVANNSLKNYKRAVEDFDKAIELNSDYAAAYVARGAALTLLGDKKRGGLEDIKTAARLGNEGAQMILKEIGASW